MGRVFDTTGSYDLALTILIPATLIGVGLMLPLGWRSETVPVKRKELQAHS